MSFHRVEHNIVVCGVVWWHPKLVVWRKQGIVTKQNFCQEKLFLSAWKSIAVGVAVQSILGEVDCDTPHSCSWEPSVEANFSLVDWFRWCCPRTVPEKCGFRILTKLALDLRHFCSVDLPQLQVLDYLYFFDNTCWYCLLKKLLHGDKTLAFGVQILQSKVFLVNNLRDGIDPVFRQV